MATADAPPKPKSWPKEAEETYEAIRPLGKGAFGLVWLAKRKEQSSFDPDATSEEDSPYVAIKHIKTLTSTERAYAEREISILSELHHPCIIRLIKAYDPATPASRSRLVVMSLADGPDIGTLISTGGALSLPLARLIARHLISAVSYLHGRGVIHRDIKPDNVVLVRKGGPPETTSARDDIASDDTLWCKTGDDESEESMESKWKAVLVDFGFARALSPSDVVGGEADSRRMRNSIINEGETVATAAKAALKDQPPGEKDDDKLRAVKPSPTPSKDRRGVGRASMATMKFKMSALGTKAFAAPEIKNKARMDEIKEGAKANASSALTECVADYGMITDAFSVGTTLRMVLTGVPADESNVTEYISSQTNPLAQLLSAVFGACASKDNKKRKKQYRYLSAIPKDAANLLRDLTKPKPDERITVRQAQANLWICGGDDEPKYELLQGDYPSTTGTPINFLKCAGKVK